ncbi:MAG: hypothetical protein NVSMB25_02060 [Thermoleophilaceae bacterium]
MRRVDAGICILLTLFGAASATSTHRVAFGAALTAAFFTLPLLWRRSAPLAACGAFALGVAANAAFAHAGPRCGAAIPIALLLLFSAGTRLGRGGAIAALTLGLAGMAIEDLTDTRLDAATLTVLLPFCAAAWLAGRLVRARSAAASELREQTRILEERREQTAQMAVEVERVRIATDLNDAARGRLREIVELARDGEVTPDQGSEATFGRIERRGREALDQIRGLLGVLRGDGGAATRPQPSLDQLEPLLKGARRGGRDVELHVEGRRRALPASVELSAYRILQETLEAMDHGFVVDVRLCYSDDALELEVSGNCRPEAERDASIEALTERALVHGGSLAVVGFAPGRRAFKARLPLVANNA